MSRPRLLDLFAGAGGAARGYQLAGFHVTGVDVAPQPNYIGDDFHQADALTFPLDGFDAIHASPPCKRFTTLAVLHRDVDHPDLLTPTRERLEANGAPWVIENVPGAPMRPDVFLCGSQFGLGVRRHRWFEFSVPPFALMHPCDHSRDTVCVVGHGGGSGKGAKVKRWTAAEGRSAMGIDWMTRDELAQAIPPAYCHFIGLQLIDALARVG